METIDEEDSNKERTLYRDNPSIDKLRGVVKTVGKHKITMNVGGKYEEFLLKKYKDTRSYAKFCLTPNAMASIRKLTQVSFVLLFHILDGLRYGNNEVYLTSAPFCRATGFTRTSFYRSVAQLIEERWIFPMFDSKTYSINLFRISKGPVDEVLRNDEIIAEG